MAEPIEIGVKLRADTSQLTGDVAKAKAQVDAAGADSAGKATEATKAQAAATSALGEQLKNVKKSYGEQIEVVQGLIGKIAGIAGIATIAFKVGEAIRASIVAALEDGSEKARDFISELNSADSVKNAEALSKQIRVVEGDLAATKERYDALKEAGFGATAEATSGAQVQAKLEQELADLRRRLRIEEAFNKAQEEKKAAEEAAAKEKEIQEKAAGDLATMAEEARRSLLSEEERLQVEAQDKILAIIKAHNAMAAADKIAKAAEAKAAIEAIEKALADELAKRAKAAADEAAKKAEEERKKREEEHEEYRKWWAEQEEAQRKQAEAARKAQEAWIQSLKAIRAEINATFGGEAAASITQFGQQLTVSGLQAAGNMNRIVVEGVG